MCTKCQRLLRVTSRQFSLIRANSGHSIRKRDQPAPFFWMIPFDHFALKFSLQLLSQKWLHPCVSKPSNGKCRTRVPRSIENPPCAINSPHCSLQWFTILEDVSDQGSKKLSVLFTTAFEEFIGSIHSPVTTVGSGNPHGVHSQFQDASHSSMNPDESHSGLPG